MCVAFFFLCTPTQLVCQTVMKMEDLFCLQFHANEDESHNFKQHLFPHKLKVYDCILGKCIQLAFFLLKYSSLNLLSSSFKINYVLQRIKSQSINTVMFCLQGTQTTAISFPSLDQPTAARKTKKGLSSQERKLGSLLFLSLSLSLMNFSVNLWIKVQGSSLVH